MLLSLNALLDRLCLKKRNPSETLVINWSWLWGVPVPPPTLQPEAVGCFWPSQLRDSLRTFSFFHLRFFSPSNLMIRRIYFTPRFPGGLFFFLICYVSFYFSIWIFSPLILSFCNQDGFRSSLAFPRSYSSIQIFFTRSILASRSPCIIPINTYRF